MELSTSLNLLIKQSQSPAIKNQPDYSYTAIQQLSELAKIGFGYFDFNFVDYNLGDSPLKAENWEEWLYEIKEFADKNALHFYQSHGHMFELFPEDEASELLIERSIKGSAILGVEYVIFHPYYGQDYDLSKEKTKRKFDGLLNLSSAYGVGIAVENMPSSKSTDTSCYCDNAEDLLELISCFPNSKIGVCWDTSHGALSLKNQESDIIKLGNTLKALHISDNFGRGDDHTAPLFGDNCWTAILAVLKRIDYQGTFSFETHNFTKNLPFPLKLDAIRLLYKVGLYLTKDVFEKGGGVINGK